MEKPFCGFLLQGQHTVPCIAVFLHIGDLNGRVGQGCGLFGFPFLLQFFQRPVNAVDDLRCGTSDCFKRAFQLVKLPSAAPPGNIPKGILGRIKSVMLADSIRHAFSLYLTGAAVGSVGLFRDRGVYVNVVQLCMGDFMDSGFQGLKLAHSLVNGNPLFLQVVVAVCAALDFLKTDRNKGSLFKGCENVLETLHVPGQHIHGKVWDFLSLGLRHVKDRYHLKGRYCDFFFLRYRLSVCTDYRLLCRRIDFFHFLLDFERGRCKDFDTLFAFHHISLKVIFPCVKACDKGSVWLLHGDQQRIVKAVIMEF